MYYLETNLDIIIIQWCISSVYIAYKKNSITKLMLTFILDKIKAEGEYYSAQNFFDEQS